MTRIQSAPVSIWRQWWWWLSGRQRYMRIRDTLDPWWSVLLPEPAGEVFFEHSVDRTRYTWEVLYLTPEAAEAEPDFLE